MEMITFKRRPFRNPGIFYERRRDVVKKSIFFFSIVFLFTFIMYNKDDDSSFVYFSQSEMIIMEKNTNTLIRLSDRSPNNYFDNISRDFGELYSYMVKNNSHKNARPAPSVATVVGLVSDIMVNIDLAREKSQNNVYFLKENIVFQLKSPSQFISAYRSIESDNNKTKEYEEKLVDMLIKIKHEFYMDPKLVINESKNKQKLLLLKRREK